MRTASINTQFYAPADPPTNMADTAELQRYLRNEFSRIAASIAILQKGHVEFVNVAPTKPREGDIIGADGISFNPGSGKGVYCYYGGAYHFLG